VTGPLLAPHQRMTHQVDRPADTHWRIVSCRIAAEHGECPHYVDGFVMRVPVTMAAQARQSFLSCGYAFTDVEPETPEVSVFYVLPEQQCLASRRVPHRLPLEREPILSVFDGDYRARTGQQVAMPGEFWLEHLAEHTDALERERQKG
jgi:hypothetical protein